MTFKLSKQFNKCLGIKKLGVSLIVSTLLFSTACGISADTVADVNGTPFSNGVKAPTLMNSGVADEAVTILQNNGGVMDDIVYFIPSDEISSDRVSTIKLYGTTAGNVGAQASYETLLALKNQNNSQINKPSSGGSTSNKNENVTLITPDGKLNSLIKNNKYGTDKVTVIQSGKSNLSEDTDALMAAIKSNSKCSTSFLAIRISDGASIGYNVDKQWRCMSTFKAPTALYAYKLASEGKLDLSAKMTYTSSKYYYPGSGKIKNSASGTKYTIKTLISYSLLYSDNSAYIMLRDYLSSEGIVNMCREMGCTNSECANVDWPQVSARDAALWWNEIYNFCREDSYGNALYTTFVNATGNMIDKALGYKYEVAHKSGSGSGYHHDCAIVMAEEPYILVIYTYNKAGGSSNYTYMSKVIREINEIMVG